MPIISDVRQAIVVYDVDTLSLVLWDGALNAGTVSIGTVAQGAAGVTAWKVDGSAVTQPVSGTVTAILSGSINNTAFAVTKTALTGSAPTSASVGASSAQAVASNANRKGLVLVNTSANTISLGLGNAAVLNAGITLVANGGTWVMDEYSFTTQAVNAIASGAGSNLAVQELA